MDKPSSWLTLGDVLASDPRVAAYVHAMRARAAATTETGETAAPGRALGTTACPEAVESGAGAQTGEDAS